MNARKHYVVHLGAHGAHSTIECDGVPIENARAVKIETAVDQATTITITYTNVDVDVDAVVDEPDE